VVNRGDSSVGAVIAAPRKKEFLIPLVGETTVRRDKSTEIQEGHPFEEMRAVEEARKLQRLISEKFGEEIGMDDARPQAGAFPLVDERVVAVWLQLLEANGLRRFSDRITIDWFTRNETLQKGKLEALRTPVASEPVFRFPRSPKDAATVMFRIAIIDPRFVDGLGKPLYKEIPKEYIAAVLHTMNPDVLYKIFGNSLPEMLQRAGGQSQAFDQLIKFVAGKAKGRTTPTDLETLQDYLHASILHEMVHALALHLPDVVPQEMTAEQRKPLEVIKIEKYLELVNADQSLMTSSLFFKNLIKALQRVAKKAPSEETAANVIDVLTLEMFCDRFSMFLYENFLKTQIYNKYLHELIGYPLTVDMLVTLEAARKSNQLAARQEVAKLDAKARARMEAELAAAEQDHVFIRKFGDPAITPKEWDFFTNFLNWLKQLDKENQIMRFNMQHANTSRFMHVSVAGMTQDAGVDVIDFVARNAATLTGPGALAVGLAEKHPDRRRNSARPGRRRFDNRGEFRV